MLAWLMFSGIIISPVLSIMGLLRRKAVWLATGAIFLLPVVWYLNGTPRFRGYALILPLFHFGAAIALQKGKIRLAWMLFMLVLTFFIWLIIGVLSS